MRIILQFDLLGNENYKIIYYTQMNKPFEDNQSHHITNQHSSVISRHSFVKTNPSQRVSNHQKGQIIYTSMNKNQNLDIKNISHAFQTVNFNEGDSHNKVLNRQIRLSKTLSASYRKEINQEKITPRANISVKPNSTNSNLPPDDSHTNQPSKIKSHRYKNVDKEAIQSGNYKLSLSGFQQKIHSLANTSINPGRIAKTQDEILGLKLQGANILFQQKPIKTQRQFRRSIFFKNNTNIRKTVQKSIRLTEDEKQFRTLIQKISQQPYNDEQQKLHKYDSTKLRIHHTAQKKQKKQNIARQSVKLNVLNMIGGGNNKDLFIMRPNPNFKQIYSKCFSGQQYQQKMKQTKKLNNRQLVSQLRQIQKSLYASSPAKPETPKESPANSITKYTISCAEQIYNRKKSIQKNYTFKKKQDKTGRKDLSCQKVQGRHVAGNIDDFHVQGWNINQDYQRKQIMII